MNEELVQLIESVPSDAFKDHRVRFADLSPLERLRWLQQTAWFIWRHKGAAECRKERRGAGSDNDDNLKIG
jgi:hypothetical protein